MENLSIVESDNLLLYESIIERGLKTFVEVGGALLAIREAKLYRLDTCPFARVREVGCPGSLPVTLPPEP